MIDWLALLPVCAPQVHPETMTRLVKHESGGQPWIIGVNGTPRRRIQPTSKSEAIAAAKALRAAGINFDAGLGQLNSSNIARLGLSFEQVFDPCINLRISAQILQENYARALQRTPSSQAALGFALSAYNTGSFTAGISNGYVSKVLGHATQLQPSSYSAPAAHRPIRMVMARPPSNRLDGFSADSITTLNALSGR